MRCCEPRTPAAGLCESCRHRAVTRPCPASSLSSRWDPTRDGRRGFLTRGGRAMETRNALGIWIWIFGRGAGEEGGGGWDGIWGLRGREGKG